jgi:LacI family transcriptional regulator
MAVTLKTIAEESGLSLSTVSGALGARSHLFSAETRRRVRRLADAMGYRPSGCARSMRRGRYGSVAILVADHGHLPRELMGGVDAVLAGQDCHAVSVWVPDLPSIGPPRVLREHLVDGLIVAWDVPVAVANLASEHVVPAVWVNTKRAWDSAYCDEISGTRRATERLLDLGHRRIAYADYSASSHYSSLERQKGYVNAMKAAGLSPCVVRVSITPQSARITHARDWLMQPDHPTAAVTYCPATAFPILFAATTLGRRSPTDLSLVTVDAELQDDVGIEIATLVEPNREVGRAAAEMLLEKIEHPGQRHRSRTFVPRLEEGQTLAPPAAGGR